MKCQYCQSENSKVVDKRSTGDAIRRRRECLDCGKRYTTYERRDEAPIMVIKKDGHRVMFDRDKVRLGLSKACEKRNVKGDIIEDLASKIEAKLRSKYDNDVPAKKIGEEVMRELKKLDKVAYIRFASVYREFKDLADFKDEISKL